MTRAKAGLTLVEILAVIVLLSIVAGITAVGLSGAFQKGKHELARTGIALIESRLEIYRLDHSEALDPAVGVALLSDGYASPSDAHYLKKDQITDPWGNPYYLIVPGPDGHPFEVVSYGADGQPGGAGENEDVSSLDVRTGGP